MKEIEVETQTTYRLWETLPQYARHLRSLGVTAVLTLKSGDLAATQVYQKANGVVFYVAGSRNLFDRWVQKKAQALADRNIRAAGYFTRGDHRPVGLKEVEELGWNVKAEVLSDFLDRLLHEGKIVQSLAAFLKE